MRRPGRDRSRSEHLQEVELLEHDPDLTFPGETADDPPFPGAVDAEEAHGPGSSQELRRRRWRSPLALVLAGLVAATLVTNVVVEARERSRQAALADVPGVLPSMTTPLQVLWHQPGSFVGWVAGEDGQDLLLLSDQVTTTAVDPTTGVTVWSREAPPGGEYCAPHTAPDAEGAFFGDIWFQRATLVVCQPWAARFSGEPTFGPIGVDVLESASGEVVHTLTSAGAELNVAPLGPDLWLLTTTPEGLVRAARWDLQTGELRSDVTSVAPLHIDGQDQGMGFRADDEVIILESTGRVAFSVATGLEVEPPEEELQSTFDMPLRNGDTVHLEFDGSGASTGTVMSPDGEERFPVAGAPMTPLIDDGSVLDVLVVRDDEHGGFVGLDAMTGDRLWASPADVSAWFYPLLTIDGVLVVGRAGAAEAIDIRDGRSLWTATEVSSGGAMTDGRVALLAEGDPSGTLSHLVARSLRDGEEQWRMALPASTYGVQAVPSGQVMVSTGDRVYAFG